MCGRFIFTADRADLVLALAGLRIEELLHPRYNIAPTQPVPTVLNDGQRTLTQTRWGLIPSWTKDPSIGNRLINARAETLAEKPSFRAPLKRQRCLIWATGFYEWQKMGKGKQPMLFQLTSKKPFAFAGLWDRWEGADGDEVITSTIITTEANGLVAPVHERMPVILAPEHYESWLTPGEQRVEPLLAVLGPYPADQMLSYPVSTQVNSPAVDGPVCIEPVI
ncbi:SOS response-associated peptidase [Candidatus Cyanaurora vandensis]|uniref:SOS response-associated peptidase n=1 Tax=Candidatus Cyanaurora vandensis TaxID=2714958 RepID=UPI00257FD1FB|nr:SOS response-associated peptidase [Candidatus Cyanaurora vandensis]